MKKILEDKDQFVGLTMKEIVKLDNFFEPYKLYLFDDAVLIEKEGWRDGYCAMSERDILKEAVGTTIKTDNIHFEYKCKWGHHSGSTSIYNIVSTEVTITPFGEALIGHGIVTKHELMLFANKQIAEETEDIKVKRQRHIDECLAILAKYGIGVKQ